MCKGICCSGLSGVLPSGNGISEIDEISACRSYASSIQIAEKEEELTAHMTEAVAEAVGRRFRAAGGAYRAVLPQYIKLMIFTEKFYISNRKIMIY